MRSCRSTRAACDPTSCGLSGSSTISELLADGVQAPASWLRNKGCVEGYRAALGSPGCGIVEHIHAVHHRISGLAVHVHGSDAQVGFEVADRLEEVFPTLLLARRESRIDAADLAGIARFEGPGVGRDRGLDLHPRVCGPEGRGGRRNDRPYRIACDSRPR